MKYLLLLASILITLQVNAAKKFYKWTDAQGNTHYTEVKPLNKKVTEIKVNTNKPKVAVSSQKNEKTSSQEEKTQEQKEIEAFNKKEKELVQKTQDRENCKIAQKNLASLQRTVRVKKVNPATGETIRMNDTQRVNAIKRMKDNIKKLCK